MKRSSAVDRQTGEDLSAAKANTGADGRKGASKPSADPPPTPKHGSGNGSRPAAPRPTPADPSFLFPPRDLPNPAAPCVCHRCRLHPRLRAVRRLPGPSRDQRADARREGRMPSLRGRRCRGLGVCAVGILATDSRRGRRVSFATRNSGGRDTLPPEGPPLALGCTLRREGVPPSIVAYGALGVCAVETTPSFGGKAFCLPCARQRADLVADLTKARLSARREGRMPSLRGPVVVEGLGVCPVENSPDRLAPRTAREFRYAKLKEGETPSLQRGRHSHWDALSGGRASRPPSWRTAR